ncbi:hypothetical protein AcV5_006753 [Taiwanofungus camphoratus]|nr:hypothetical protein AcV5_006753 [Antrodia cinnamomea]
MNGTERAEDEARLGSRSSFDISDTEGEDSQGDHSGDYSTRFEELMSDSENGSDGHDQDEDQDEDKGEEEEGFLYNGIDAGPAGGYREQLRDVLGPDHEEDELDEREVEKSLLHEVEAGEQLLASSGNGRGHAEGSPDYLPSLPPISPLGTLSPPQMVSTNGTSTPPRLSRTYLHPTISRLRSSTPQASRVPSSGSVGTTYSHANEGASAAPSHFSALSRISSLTNLSASLGRADSANGQSYQVREVFKWTQLRTIGDYIYVQQPQKASTLLGTENVGSPTVLAANGLICVGTDAGKVLVFDFKQNLRCVCGNNSPDKAVGSVTALALSFDQSFVACGHASGHIQLFDLNTPKNPVRFVPPVSLAAIASGRQEGHLLGSRIVSVGFVAGRHTAIVSGDDCGLAFYHSLGKVFFIEASDILRVLGKYPEEDLVSPSPFGSAPVRHAFRRRKPRKTSTILAMGPLPLGTTSHPTDQYNLVALLTPIKLVIVGLKPSPKTWYRRHREMDDDIGSKSKFKGALAWFPSVVPGDTAEAGSYRKKGNQSHDSNSRSSTIPMLVYSWSNTIYLIRVSESKVVQQAPNSRTGKLSDVEVGRVVFEETSKWTAGGDILALQWLNVNQIIVLTYDSLEVYDVRSSKLVEHVPYDVWSLVSPILGHTMNGSLSYPDAVMEVAHSVRVYKGKIFLLMQGQHELQVGTLLTWADRILSSVQNGDFLSAIELTRSYFIGEAPGNRNGLPDTPEKLQEVVGEKMHELMVASARYAFSEDRMIDGTHITSDGRGVDRTSLFEGLVKVCARACIALDDYDFLFEDLFQYYDDNGISRIFLSKLEPFVLDSSIRHVPPRITQRLIALHDEDNRPDAAERIIWHIDPDCLDVNQALTLCQKHQLYDALIYVFTRAMKDYVSPIAELLGLIRKVQQYRKARREGSLTTPYMNDEAIEPVVLNAYKVYPYLGDILSGLSFPSEEPLPEDEALQARNDVYSFLFFGRSSVWPLGEGGKLILTSDEENGVEPTYPYTRLLLRFDPEAFLHTLDSAFEDSYFNDETRRISRLVIVKILLEILSSPGLSRAEVTFVNIFIARNVAKYHQFIFIQIPPSALHGILIGLAVDPDHDTREDRQLAAEYLLSVYTPHESERIASLFEKAGFYRILRSWYQQDRRWTPLFLTYLNDPDLSRSSVIPSVDGVLDIAERSNKGVLPRELVVAVTESLPTLLSTNVVSTAALLERHVPALHERAIDALEQADDRFAYLRYLLGPPQPTEEGINPPWKSEPPCHVPSSLRNTYILLHCRLDPSGVIAALCYLPSDFLKISDVIQTCEEHEVFDAVIWAINRDEGPRAALSKTAEYESTISARIADALIGSETDGHILMSSVDALESMGHIANSICLEHSQLTPSADVPLEDIWFQLLSCQIDTVQRVAGCCSAEALDPSHDYSTDDTPIKKQKQTVSALRSLVQGSFSSLMSISSLRAVSLPRLFKRLLDSASKSPFSKPALYAEFRAIFTGMLESYRSDSDMLMITKHLVDRDLFATIGELAHEQTRGWAASQGVCRSCGESFLDAQKSATSGEPGLESRVPIIVSRTGAIYHSRFHTNTNNIY